MENIKPYLIKFYILTFFLSHFIFVTQCQFWEYWSSLLHVSFTRVYVVKYSNAMHNNCSLVRHRKKRDFVTIPPPETKIKPPNALYAKYPLASFWGGHSQNDSTIKKYFTPISLLSSINLLREPEPFKCIT